MKRKRHGKQVGMIILTALIIFSIAEFIYRATVIGEAVLTTSNLGEQLVVIVLATSIIILTAKGKDRASYICYGAWIAYFVLDQTFELPGVIIGIINQMAQTETIPAIILIRAVIRVLSMVGIIAIGGILFEYMTDGTIYNKAFNTLCITTILLLNANIAFSIYGAVVVYPSFALDTFNYLYRLAMVFLMACFAYDSAKLQLSKTKLTK